MNKSKKQKGFTIIEVVLVLAIAGLIFMMVFIALPSLQRSQRDMQRKNDLNRLATALASYQSNNRGALPSGMAPSEATSWPSFVERYVRTGGDDFRDPSGGGDDEGEYNVSTTATLPTTFDPEQPVIVVTVGATCDGEGLTTGQGSRKVAFQMALEGGGVACQSN
jgi:prepilin-type N-terminal cleavage/methylation domain-containing protein